MKFIKKYILKLWENQQRVEFYRGGAGLRRAPKGGNRARKFSPSCGVGQGWGKTKSCEVRVKI